MEKFEFQNYISSNNSATLKDSNYEATRKKWNPCEELQPIKTRITGPQESIFFVGYQEKNYHI